LKRHRSFEICIAENNEPPNTPATPSMWKGCIKMFNELLEIKRLGLFHIKLKFVDKFFKTKLRAKI
jgi:hypothetical protein